MLARRVLGAVGVERGDEIRQRQVAIDVMADLNLTALTRQSPETALQLLNREFVAPNDDAEAFALLKRQIGAQVANRSASPQVVFGEALQKVIAAKVEGEPVPTADLLRFL